MKNTLAILIFTIFIFGCGDDTSDDLLPDISDDLPYLTLTSPLDTTVDYCNTTLTWESNITDPAFIIEIATDNRFQDIILKDSITFVDFENTYTIDGNLEPNKTFYWRISAGNIIGIDRFSTMNENDLNDFVGTFLVNAYHYHPMEPDTTWTETLTLNFTSDAMPQLIKSNGDIVVLPEIFESSSNCEKLYYREMPNPEDPTVVVENRCTLDLTNRTFKFYRGHESTHFDIYTEYSGSID